MENNKIQIKLDFADNADVSLENMSSVALESFLKVTSALKNIAESISDDFVYSITKGSASTTVLGDPHLIHTMYSKMDEAIEGKSNDEVVTSNLRTIQSEIKNDVLRYQFLYSDIPITEKIKNAKKIKKKKIFNVYNKELKILFGKFNAVGGSVINYHLDHGSGHRDTVDCSQEQALELKDFLFQNVFCLVIKTYSTNNNDNYSYQHCTYINSNQIERFKSFTKNLQELDDILERLDFLYNFFETSPSVIDDMATILRASNYIFDDINEIKTVLIISKGMKDNAIIKGLREKVLNNFQLKMSKL